MDPKPRSTSRRMDEASPTVTWLGIRLKPLSYTTLLACWWAVYTKSTETQLTTDNFINILFLTWILNFYCKTNQMHNISNLFYFGTTLYMFRTVSPSIIRSLRLYIQHQVYVIQVLWLLASCLLASSHRTCMTYIWCSMYILRLLMMDGETVRNM